jgi:hypothetical protein
MQGATMQRRRILILGQTKENTYEVRNLLDNRRCELELALNLDTARVILGTRRMHLLVVHTEALDERFVEFIENLLDTGVELRLVLVGEEASTLRERLDFPELEIRTFDKPYPVDEMVSFISNVECRV